MSPATSRPVSADRVRPRWPWPSAISLVNAGLGHALVDPVSADGFLRRRDCRVTVVPFEPAIALEIALITSRFHPPSRHCQRFLPYPQAGLEAWQQHSRRRLGAEA